MRLRRLLSDPLRALVALELAAVVCSYVVDVVMATMHINKNAGDQKSVTIYTVEYIATTIALFFIPHRPNRRYWAIGLGLCMVPVMVLSPTGALGPVVIIAVLAARLTFAFGFRGTAVAWLVTFASIMIDPVMQYAAGPTFRRGAYVVSDAIVILVFTSLLYGVIGIMWLYARNSASVAASAERTRIALDLHDSLGHALTTLGVHLENADRLAAVDAERTRAYITRAGALTSEILSDVRETVAMLHDGEETQAAPLSSLLDRLRSDFAAAYPVDVHWCVALEREPLGRSALVVYRVLQEALTNVNRHAQAHRVSVEVRGDNDRVFLCVEDDGRGFVHGESISHGLASMRNRVEAVAGTIDISSTPGAGTRVHASFPLERSS